MAGRHRKHPELQRLRGNPRKVAKRKLREQVPPVRKAAAKAKAKPSEDVKTGEVLAPLTPAEVACPDFLTHEREKAIFRLIIAEFMPRNLARETDFNAYGRYAVYMHMWIQAKQQLGQNSTWYKTTSKHGEMLRRNPAFQDMIDLGHELRQMEPQLALTPLARNAIYSRFAPGSSLPAGDLFPPDKRADEESGGDEAPLAPSADSPLGALARAATPAGRPN